MDEHGLPLQRARRGADFPCPDHSLALGDERHGVGKIVERACIDGGEEVTDPGPSGPVAEAPAETRKAAAWGTLVTGRIWIILERRRNKHDT